MRHFIVVALSALFLISNASAWGSGVTDPYSVYANTEKGSDFEAKFEIEADGDGTYAIELERRNEFTFSSYRIEKDILDGDSRTYIFNGENAQTLADGEYRITWTAYKDGQEIDNGDFDISVGEQAPGFGLIVALISIGLMAVIRKRNS